MSVNRDTCEEDTFRCSDEQIVNPDEARWIFIHSSPEAYENKVFLTFSG